MNTRTDEETVIKRLAELKKARNQYVGAKDKLAEQMDRIDVTDPTYDAKYSDMCRRLDKFYYEISETDRDIAEAQRDLTKLKENQSTLESAYEFLRLTSDTLPQMKDYEKKEIINAFVEKIAIFPERQDDGKWVKAIYFRFPVMICGKEGEIWSRDESHVETVALLQRCGLK